MKKASFTFLFQLAFAALFIALFFIYPSVIESGFEALMWLMLALFLAGAGIYFFLKVTKRKPESLGIRVVPEAGIEGGIWVGSKGQNLWLSIKETVNGTHVRWAAQNYWLIIVSTAFFGPGLLLLYYLQPQKFHFGMPFPMLVFCGLLWALIWWILPYTLYRYLFKQPSFIISAACVDLLEGTISKKKVWRQNIDRFCVVETTFTSDDSLPIANYVLVVEERNGVKSGICITDKRMQVDQLLSVLDTKGFSV